MPFARILLLIFTTAVTSLAMAGQLNFEKTPYGLLFTDISVAGKPVRAMIDFGDPYSLQLATSFLDEFDIETRPTGQKAMYADGTTFDLLEGEVNDVEIGGELIRELRFGSAPGEIDAVAEQVGTVFQASVGWGFLGSRRFLLDYEQSSFDLSLTECPLGSTATVSRVEGDRYLMLQGSLGDRNVRFLVDTGSPLNVVHSQLYEEGHWPGNEVMIKHLVGEVPGYSLPFTLGDWEATFDFEVNDLAALEPLGVDAILGAPFLASIRLCHEPNNGLIHVFPVQES